MKAQLHVAGMAVGGLACLFSVIAMATTGWLVYDTLKVGLFVVCRGRIGCSSFSPTGAEAATRFFVVMSFLLCVAGLASAIIHYVKNVLKDVANRNMPLAAGVCFVIAGPCALVGAIIWGAKVKSDYSSLLKLGYSFGLDIVAALLAIGAGALIMVQRSREY